MKYCYDKKAEKWPFIACGWWDNFWASRRASFVEEMVESMRLKVVRIHEAGDSYTPAYARMWAEIARRLPAVKFYAYTKSIPYVTPLMRLPNFTVIFSEGGKQVRLEFYACHDRLELTYDLRSEELRGRMLSSYYWLIEIQLTPLVNGHEEWD